MLKFSKKVEYALIALLYLEDSKEEFVSAKEIGRRFQIPQDILGKVLQSLSGAKILGSIRGSRGGYYLLKPLEEISVHEVVSAVDRPINLVDCADEEGCQCAQASFCNIQNPMLVLQEKLVRFFSQLTLKDLKKELPLPIQSYFSKPTCQ
ncbi:MAG: Rrf2 family transcriptional regulator [Planctomycetota bacterium]|nr:MAG: Rrf2 family transcriptional regulator [Planctomycetota bacterium]